MARRVGANRRKKIRERRGASHRSARGLLRPALRLARFIVLACLVGGAGVVGARKVSKWLDSSAMFVVENIRVRGVHLLDTTAVLTKADIALGTHLGRLDAGAVAAHFADIPLVRRVRMRRRLPNTVDILVQERKPIAMLNTGSVWLVDAEGVVFPLVAGRYADVPVVSGLRDTVFDDGTRRLSARSRERLMAFLDGMRRAQPTLLKRITQVAFRDEGWVRMKLDARRTVIDMDTGEIEKRSRQLWHLIQNAWSEGSEAPRRIDLRFSNLAFVQ